MELELLARFVAGAPSLLGQSTGSKTRLGRVAPATGGDDGPAIGVGARADADAGADASEEERAACSASAAAGTWNL